MTNIKPKITTKWRIYRLWWNYLSYLVFRLFSSYAHNNPKGSNVNSTEHGRDIFIMIHEDGQNKSDTHFPKGCLFYFLSPTHF